MDYPEKEGILKDKAPTPTHPLSVCFSREPSTHCIGFLTLPVSRRSSHGFSRYFTWTTLSTELPSDLAEWWAVDGTNFYQLQLGWHFLTHQAILQMPDTVNGTQAIPQGVCGSLHIVVCQLPGVALVFWSEWDRLETFPWSAHLEFSLCIHSLRIRSATQCRATGGAAVGKESQTGPGLAGG